MTSSAEVEAGLRFSRASGRCAGDDGVRVISEPTAAAFRGDEAAAAEGG